MTLCKVLQDTDLYSLESLTLNKCKLRDDELKLILNSIKDF